jgi:hypothetical protein
MRTDRADAEAACPGDGRARRELLLVDRIGSLEQAALASGVRVDVLAGLLQGELPAAALALGATGACSVRPAPEFRAERVARRRR